MATCWNYEQNGVFKLINKILLFQYSDGIFSGHTRAVTLTLAHITEIITFFLTRYKLSQNPPFRGVINAWILKQLKFVNEPLVSCWNHEQNRVFKLINEILLFRYSEGNFLAHTRAVTLTLPHITEIITLFLTHMKLSQN